MTINKIVGVHCAFYFSSTNPKTGYVENPIMCRSCDGLDKTLDCYLLSDEKGLDITLKKMNNDIIHLAMYYNVPETNPVNKKDRRTKE